MNIAIPSVLYKYSSSAICVYGLCDSEPVFNTEVVVRVTDVGLFVKKANRSHVKICNSEDEDAASKCRAVIQTWILARIYEDRTGNSYRWRELEGSLVAESAPGTSKHSEKAPHVVIATPAMARSVEYRVCDGKIKPSGGLMLDPHMHNVFEQWVHSKTSDLFCI